MSALRGIVLAGGESSRFGGDKALAEYGGERLLEHAVRLLREVGLSPLVVTRKDRDYAFLACEVIHDLLPNKGPLGGLYTACQFYPQSALLVLTCDMPKLSREILQVLIRNHPDGGLASVFDAREEYVQPFPGIYSASLAERMHAFLAKGELSMREFLKGLPELHLVEFDFSKNALANINRKADFN